MPQQAHGMDGRHCHVLLHGPFQRDFGGLNVSTAQFPIPDLLGGFGKLCIGDLHGMVSDEVL